MQGIATMKNTIKENHGEEWKTGVITPYQWDEEDKITAVMLSTTDDEEYLIENSDKFIPYVHTSVWVAGVIKDDRKAVKSIDIRRFSVLDDFQ
jgi:hypothetical protein